MPTAKVNGINLAYNIKGNGPPLILIIGFASAQNLWYSTVRAFSKSYRVVTFDNRGFGKSDKPPGPYTTQMLASDTLGLMDYLGIEKAHILGGSLGGMVAQEIAIAHPERLDRLILSATNAGGQRLNDRFSGMIRSSYPAWDPAKPEELTPARLQKFMVDMTSLSFGGILKTFSIAAGQVAGKPWQNRGAGWATPGHAFARCAGSSGQHTGSHACTNRPE